MKAKFLMTVAVALILGGTAAQGGEDPPMGFFVTSVGMGDGANLGGVEGADAHCTKLAEAAGSKGRTWRAYLSTQEDGKRGISARNRIGPGPWYNAKGELIAVDLDQLHIMPNIYLRTALDEDGNRIMGFALRLAGRPAGHCRCGRAADAGLHGNAGEPGYPAFRRGA